MMVLKLEMRFVIRQCMLGELSRNVKPILRERIVKSIVEKLIKAKDKFGLGAPIKGKTPKIY